jgi:predicted nucleotidyltransferase
MPAFDAYRATLRKRMRRDARAQEQRRAQAQNTARQVAQWLRTTYGVKRVVLFGSIAGEKTSLGPRSDIDLAVWGLDPKLYFEAVARAQDKAAPFSVDLVQAERCADSLQAVIARDGMVL